MDSELTLLLVENYPKVQWLPNPLNFRFDAAPAMQRFRQAVVMVGRLDGPTPEIARRLVDDALDIEKTGLKGTCYLDARGLKGDGQVGSYDWYDAHLVSLAQLMKERSTMKVVLDQKPGLFPPGSCPQAALYCGWYSLAKYVASCTWQKGAVALSRGQRRGHHPQAAGEPGLVQAPAGGGGGRHPGSGERTLPHSLSPAGRFFPPPDDGETESPGGVFPHCAPPFLADDPDRRPPVHPVSEKPGLAGQAAVRGRSFGPIRR